MSLFGALNIASSSLKAQQQAINVVSNNIANVNTPGYSRQTPTLGTAVAEQLDGFNFGRGVQLSDIRRVVDPFLIRAQVNNGSQFTFSNTVEQGLNAVESVFGSLGTPGLATSLDAFFQAFQQLANNPQDTAQRFNIRAHAQDIVNELSGMRSQLVAAQTSADANIDQSITQANILLDKIASLNDQIRTREVGINGQANDLRDQRELAVSNLAKLLPVQVVNGANGEFIIQSKGGDLLVQDNTVRHLARGGVGPSGFPSIVIQNTNAVVQGLNQGGKIGGMLALRDGQLSSYITQVDSIAANLTFGVNQLHTSGVGQTLPATVTSGQTATDLTGTSLAVDADTSVPFASQIITGTFKVHVYDSTGTPTPAGGATISITAGTSKLNDVATQLNGVAGISASVDTTGRLIINAVAGNTIGFSNDTSNFLAAYEVNSFFHGGNASNIAISSNIAADGNNIAAGVINSTTSLHPPGDNGVALGIFTLQNTAITFDGTTQTSLHNRSTNLSSQYGTDVATARQNRLFRGAESQSLASQRESFSGVNTDEELIAMIKFQRAYQASAKVIQTTNTMLDSLMGLIR
ncbi:MAG: flagellar hook-associated protein FlgK [Mariprofundaceae bacterium]|nr:flagellar hook-associated protein FlgK [Mariprofundaceae bacterium]